MDKEQLVHLEKMRMMAQRRLRVLELKAVQFGADTPAATVIEIEDIRRSIDELERQIKVAKISAQSSSGNVSLQIVIDGEIESFTDERLADTIQGIAVLSAIPPENIRVLRVIRGSIRIDIELSEEDARRVLEHYWANGSAFQTLGIQRISLISGDTLSKGHNELWLHISSLVSTEAERVVLIASFVEGLPPREIAKRYPDLFRSFEDVYKVKRNLLGRLNRSRALKRLYELYPDEFPFLPGTTSR